MIAPRLLMLTVLAGAMAMAAAQPAGPGATGKPVGANAAGGPGGAGGSGGPRGAGVPGVPGGPGPGQGTGFHSPQSQFPPLKEREGVVSWKLLSSVTRRTDGAMIRPVYPAAVQALHNREVTVQGFMMPLEPGKVQKHFLLSAVPTTCQFCTPAGPEGLVEIMSSKPVPFSQEAVTVRGKMSVLPNDPYGMYYRLADVQIVK